MEGSPPSTARDDPKEHMLRRLKALMGSNGFGEIEQLRSTIEAAESIGISEKEELQPALQLLKKLEERQNPLTFTDVPRGEAQELLDSTSRAKAVKILSRCMNLSLDDGFQSDILTEYHYHNFAFCLRMKMDAEKTSTLLSIMKALHSKAVVEQRMPILAARRFFCGLVERHSQQLPPYSVEVFSRAEETLIKDYAERTFFRHYKMYLFAYVRRMELCVQATSEPVMPEVRMPAEYHKRHECNPTELPELRELFRQPEAPASWQAVRGQSPLQAEDDAKMLNDAREVEVAEAMEAAMETHLGALTSKLQALP
eukprot:gnl/TRDRNA2_/TRDRNA2_185659_c0_seq1.p1 gnl/TRDRNA2_/TRDRNA2_185659_c0~~gnl/TRDRNA2_/TRDRNA2_185659_c0_seq1.p1  ORF type:complete len:312 (+),score=91.24 gnl/TRDRNA2_/TRDRNA2_185659_c0_seq1:55-990(+)